MEKVRNRAVKELEGMGLDPVDRIVLAVGHDVPAWLEPAYVELCTRENPLLEAEAQRLGLSTTLKLMCAREKIRANTPPNHARATPIQYTASVCSFPAISSISLPRPEPVQVVRELFPPIPLAPASGIKLSAPASGIKKKKKRKI